MHLPRWYFLNNAISVRFEQPEPLVYLSDFENNWRFVTMSNNFHKVWISGNLKDMG